MSEPFNIAISGYYGCGNTGDEAVLAGIAQCLRDRTEPGSTHLTVLSNDVDDTRARHGLDAVDRMHLPTLRALFDASGLLLSGGGSLLQDVTSLRSLLYYLWVIRVANKCGCPTVFCAQGIGPLKRRVSRVMVRLAANHAKAVTVRDAESAALLKRIGVKGVPITVTADPAFALNPSPQSRAVEILKSAGADAEAPLMAVSVRSWHSAQWNDAQLSQLVREAGLGSGLQPVFIPMQPEADMPLSKEIAAQIPGSVVITEPLSPNDCIAVIQKCRLTLAMRLHTLIFAAAAESPMVALSYDPKVDQLMRRLGLSEFNIPLTEAEPSRISSVIREVQSRRNAVEARLQQASTPMRDLAARNIDIALRSVGRGELLRSEFRSQADIPAGETEGVRRTLEVVTGPPVLEQTP